MNRESCTGKIFRSVGIILAIIFTTLSFLSSAQDSEQVSAAARMGERLFLETRFAQFFFTNSAGNANFQLAAGDPALDTLETLQGPQPGPFKGLSMNCRACHLVNETQDTLGNRTYCDFTTRSPVPDIGDGIATTPRNSPPLVDAFLVEGGSSDNTPRYLQSPLFLHADGEFVTTEDLIISTLTGRNYGWKPTEYATAVHHIAHIIRDDDGSNALAKGQFGGGYSYKTLFNYPPAFGIPSAFRLGQQYLVGDLNITNQSDPNYVSDDAIVNNVAALIHVYLQTLIFLQDTNGQFSGSPYDVFLIKNGLPRQPDQNETSLHYSQRLLGLITNLTSPQYVTDPADGHFETQNQNFEFGTNELAGLTIFFTLSGGAKGRTGNCVACHAPPAFTDFIFHNTGASQEEYDSIHGEGSFQGLYVPGLCERMTNYNAYLPPTPTHPNATGRFRAPPTLNQPGDVDLGLWNVLANPDFPAPQPDLQEIMPELITLSSPQITEVSFDAGVFCMSGSNGLPGWPFYVLASTNLSQPTAEWEIIETNVFDAAGGFHFTNVAAIYVPQKFYLLAQNPIIPAGTPLALELPYTIGLFKTPTVRDLGQSEPYFHTGRMKTLEDVINFYQTFSGKARSGSVRNGDPIITGISLDNSAIAPLAAFLRSLNEDYTD